MTDLIAKIQSDPELINYIREYPSGTVLFYEGDESSDIFMLLSGSLEVKKGHRTIAIIGEPGEIFGEIASFLEKRRTATLKTLTDTKVLQIPYKIFDEIKVKHPWLDELISRYLAKRVVKTTDILFAMEQVCDKIPEALLITDENGKIISFNSQASQLFENQADNLIGNNLSLICDDCNLFSRYMEVAKVEGIVKDQIASVTVPGGQKRYLAISINCNKDPFGSVRNFIFLMRDITQQIKREQRLKALFKYLTIVFISILPLVGFMVYYYESRLIKLPSNVFTNVDLLNHLREDAKSLGKLLISAQETNESSQLSLKISELLDKTQAYRRIIVVDPQNRVVIDKQLDKQNSKKISKYTSSQLKAEGAPFKVLRLYEATPDRPTGRGILHIAYRVEKNRNIIGWIIFEPISLVIDEGIYEFN